MKTIVWDVDDVLNDLMLCWFKDFRNTRKNININYKDLKENPPYDILKMSFDEYLLSLDNFRMSEKAVNMMPNREVFEWFKEHGIKYRHIALTSRSRKTVHVLADWLFRIYGDWIRTISFIPATRADEDLPFYDKSKAGFMEWFNHVDLFIDDSEENIIEADKAGINTLSFPQPWNSSSLTVEQLLQKVSSL